MFRKQLKFVFSLYLFINILTTTAFAQRCLCKRNTDCETGVCTESPLNYCFNGECVDLCHTDDDCPFKKCVNGACGCLVDSDCPGAFPYCYPVPGRDFGDCRLCKTDGDCSSKGVNIWNYCINGNCKACRDHLICNDGAFCNKDNNCQYCQTNSDCPSALGQYCNADLGMCCTNANCTCTSNTDCSEWFPNCVNDSFTGISRCRGCSYNTCQLFCHNNLCCKNEGCACKTRFDCPQACYCGPEGYCKKCPLHHNNCP